MIGSYGDPDETCCRSIALVSRRGRPLSGRHLAGGDGRGGGAGAL